MAKKKIIIYGLVIIALIAAYLVLAYFFIFYRIGVAELKMPNRQDNYILSPDNAATESLSYVALGDSLTVGVGAAKYEESYPYLLSSAFSFKLGEKISLKSFAYPGAKTSDLINDLLPSSIGAKPDQVTILIGINDVYGNVSLNVFEKNYHKILERLTKNTSAKIYPIGLPLIGSPSLLIEPYRFYYYRRIEKFNKIIKELAGEYNLKYIDLATAELIELGNNRSYFSKDLFHPSAFGYKIWAQKIYDVINK